MARATGGTVRALTALARHPAQVDRCPWRSRKSATACFVLMVAQHTSDRGLGPRAPTGATLPFSILLRLRSCHARQPASHRHSPQAPEKAAQSDYGGRKSDDVQDRCVVPSDTGLQNLQVSARSRPPAIAPASVRRWRNRSRNSRSDAQTILFVAARPLLTHALWITRGA
jgi:hypothetical protein